MKCLLELTIFILFAFALLRVYFSQVKKIPSLLPLLESLAALQIQLTLGKTPPQKDELSNLILESYFQGRPLSEPFTRISEQVLKDEEFRLTKKRMLSLFLTRIFAVLGVSLFARIFIDSYFMQSEKTIWDLISLVTSCFLSLVFLLAMNHFYPKTWFKEKEGEDWLQGLLLSKVSPNSPIYETWMKVDDQEKTSGICLASTKNLLLKEWSSKRNMELQKRMRLFEDFAPAAEFLCLGLSSVLILSGPILAVLNL